MKWMLLMLLALPATQSIAQNLGKQYEWVKLAPDEMPLKSNNPYYDITVPMEDDAYTREQLEANANYYFNNVFGTSLVRNEGKHKFSGIGNYSFSVTKSNNPRDIYTVTYIMDIATKNGKYVMTMHDFKLTHLDLEVSVPKRLEAAEKDDMLSKQIITGMHRSNLSELRKAYTTMLKKDAGNEATASK